MNLVIVAYIVYLTTNTIAIVKIGTTCYQQGLIYVEQLLPKNKDLSKKINQILLIGYYLLNIGYCTTTLLNWPPITNLTNLVEVVSLKSAYILISIAIMHYINIASIIIFIKKTIK